MKRSEHRILTTHVGSLPRPPELVAAWVGEPAESPKLATVLRSAVAGIVARQREVGLDVINDGEFGKPVHGESDYGAWMNYVSARMSGFDIRFGRTGMFPGKDREDFRDFYLQQAEVTGEHRPAEVVCVGPVRYTGHAAIRRDLENLRAALGTKSPDEVFVPLASPTSLESLQPNEFYRTPEEYAWALAEAMKEEYEEVARAGFIVQVDDPGIWVLWDFWFAGRKSFEDFRRFAAARIEALNHALSGIPQEQIRYHLCWGSWHGPHSTDAPLAAFVDLLLQIRAGAYCVEAANVRHATDWKVWQDTALPEGRILVPGVVSHSTNLLETPDLIADRICQYAAVLGRERVMAGTDCGLGGRVHETIAWAKLKALVEGARLASERLWTASG
jgi:5-methyltetrahydropteroyltriglutamate--homocysteine methyltransferase